MPSNVDQVADFKSGGVELFRLRKLYQFPEFVKTASVAKNFEIPATTAPTIYADPVRKQFPCHTKASAWLSYLFYQEKHAEYHPKDRRFIEERFAAQAKYWNLGEEFKRIRSSHNDLYKQANAELPDSAYAYVWVDETGHKDRKLPMRSAEEVKAAADWLHEYCDRIAYTDRNVIANRILLKAASFGAGIGDKVEFLERQAGRGVCSPKEVVQMIEDRAKLTDDVTLRAHFMKLAGVVRDTPRQALTPDMMVKLAGTIDTLDRGLNLVGKYSAGLPRAEDVLFKATFTKVASERANLVPTTSGKVYDKQGFQKLALADVEALFGTDFADRVKDTSGSVDPEKMAEEVATLPRPDAELLDGLLSDNGISPMLTKAASASHGFNEAEKAAWANAYAAT